MSAPGPANVTMAKAALAAVGLKDGDYSIDQLDMGQHVNAMTAGTFDAGYTLEPNASTMRKLGVATTIEAGVIAHYVLGDPNANAFVGGCALTTDFIKSRPDVAKRFTAAWEKAARLINENPKEARKHLVEEHVHARGRGRYRADGPLLHGQGPHRQGQGGLSRSSSTSRSRPAR